MPYYIKDPKRDLNFDNHPSELCGFRGLFRHSRSSFQGPGLVYALNYASCARELRKTETLYILFYYYIYIYIKQTTKHMSVCTYVCMHACVHIHIFLYLRVHTTTWISGPSSPYTCTSDIQTNSLKDTLVTTFSRTSYTALYRTRQNSPLSPYSHPFGRLILPESWNMNSLMPLKVKHKESCHESS